MKKFFFGLLACCLLQVALATTVCAQTGYVIPVIALTSTTNQVTTLDFESVPATPNFSCVGRLEIKDAEGCIIYSSLVSYIYQAANPNNWSIEALEALPPGNYEVYFYELDCAPTYYQNQTTTLY